MTFTQWQDAVGDLIAKHPNTDWQGLYDEGWTPEQAKALVMEDQPDFIDPPSSEDDD